MDLTKFTERSRAFIQAAQTIALREDHQLLEPTHILKALDCAQTLSRVRAAIYRGCANILRQKSPRCPRLQGLMSRSFWIMRQSR